MIEQHYLQLLEVDGFIQRYFELMCVYPTAEASYEATERQFQSAFGKRKYSDYTTFRVTLSRWGKKK